LFVLDTVAVDDKIADLQELIKRLPQVNRLILHRLLLLLYRITENTTKNRMGSLSLSTVIVPNLLWPKDPPSQKTNPVDPRTLINFLIQNAREVFYPWNKEFQEAQAQVAALLQEKKKQTAASTSGTSTTETKETKPQQSGTTTTTTTTTGTNPTATVTAPAADSTQQTNTSNTNVPSTTAPKIPHRDGNFLFNSCPDTNSFISSVLVLFCFVRTLQRKWYWFPNLQQKTILKHERRCHFLFQFLELGRNQQHQ
jgi:hypothetical protein